MPVGTVETAQRAARARHAPPGGAGGDGRRRAAFLEPVLAVSRVWLHSVGSDCGAGLALDSQLPAAGG